MTKHSYRQPIITILICLAIILLMGFLDYTTGYQYSFAFFYLIPVIIAAWFAGFRISLAISIVSALVWYQTNKLAGETHSAISIYYWNTFTRLGFFIVSAYLADRLKRALETEKKFARTDSLTGSMNSRSIYLYLEGEIQRIKQTKEPITLCIIDIDNLKHINNYYGQLVGDDLVKVVSELISKTLRETDIIARLGGDIFAAYLPNTDQSSARELVDKVRGVVLAEMKTRGWPVTLSFGALTCVEPPSNVDAMFKAANSLTYDVKASGKNDAKFGIRQV